MLIFSKINNTTLKAKWFLSKLKTTPANLLIQPKTQNPRVLLKFSLRLIPTTIIKR